MKIALIFTPLRLKRNWSTLVAQDKHVGIMPPLSLAYVAAVAEKAGHKVMIIDAVAEQLTVELVVKRIQEFSPDILGFTMTTYGFHQTLAWINNIKEKIKIPVMVGGWHLSLYPKETMHHDAIDYSVIGEAENILPEFLRALESGGPLYNIKGIAFRDNERVILNPPAPITVNLDTVYFPARHLLKNELYFNILSRTKNFTVMLSARGCPYSCIFCDLNTKEFRMRSVLNFVEEIEINYREFQIKEFDIYDSSFTIDKERVIKICEEIRKRGLKVSWTARSRVDTVDKYLLRAMALAGCNTLMYGIETGDPGILSRLRKHTNLDNIKEIVETTKECGIKALGFFMIGSPGETTQTALRTIKFSKSLKLDYVQVTKLTPFPNTEIYRMLLDIGFGDYWREFTLGPRLEKELPSIGTELTPRQINRLVKRAYLSFYFRPSYIFQAIREANNFLASVKNNGIIKMKEGFTNIL